MDEVKNKLYNILYVEDMDDAIFVVSRCLKDKYNLVTASNKEEAWDLLNSNDIDLVLLDIYLGQSIDGFSIAIDIRNDEKYSKIPIIAVTAYSFELEDGETNVYVDGLLRKPFESEVLISSIKKFLK